MSERWKALREYLKRELHESVESFAKAFDRGDKATADTCFAYSVAMSNAIGTMDNFGEMTDEEVAEWRAKN